MAAKSQSKSAYQKRLEQLFGQKSSGGNTKFVTDVTGYLIKLESPSETGRSDTYEYEGQQRATTWRATIRTTDNKEVWWNWPAFLDDNMSFPGINIIQEGKSVNDLLAGKLARFYRDGKSRRSRIVLIERTAQKEPDEEPEDRAIAVPFYEDDDE